MTNTHFGEQITLEIIEFYINEPSKYKNSHNIIITDITWG